ncbi:TPA: tetratricopeptide repeat protein [Candidatus Micrarchaeota archaeon]|nr:tetratricopeptide repeat protein [Candidatus Micrarchaeota archaeon]
MFMSRQTKRTPSRREFLRNSTIVGGAAGLGIFARGSRGSSEQSRARYSTATNPFAAGARVQAIVAEVRRGGGDQRVQVQRLFSRLSARAANGISAETSGLASDTRAPRTAEGTLGAGTGGRAGSGDCTEMATVVIACLQQLGISGGGRIVHFQGSPATVEHMVAFANIRGSEITIDLQATALGQTMLTVDRTIQSMTFAQAAGMYHREYGNYLRNQRRNDEAISAFEEAIRRNPDDAYCHHKLAVILHERNRGDDRQRAALERIRASELAPGNQIYLREAAPAAYDAAFTAYDAGRTDDARRHFQQCVDFSTRLNAGDGGASGRAIGARYLPECRDALGQL